jgi:conjugative relaxase-like TrwC/TraI family protein
MLTIARGYSVKYLTEEVAKGRENYYTDAVAAGEPPGRWYGAGAEKLGLTGLVDERDMTAVFEQFVDPRDEAFSDPARWGEASTLGHTGRNYPTEDELYAAALDAEPHATPERREQLRLDAGKRARQNLAFLDATFSVQKSVTVLHTAFEAQQVQAERTAERLSDALNMAAGVVADPAEWAELARQRDDARAVAASWRAHRDAVEDAIWAGNRAALDYLSEHAGYSRVGHHGGAAGRFVDAHDFVVASFFQHDSRNHDPQLHIHNAILNRVQGVDGQWRTLDSRAIHKFRAAASAVGERTTEEHLARALGVRFAARPDGKAREVVGISPQVMELFSSRRRAITKKTASLVQAFETRFGREPNSLELDRLQRQATFATRKAKSHDGETVEERLERWDSELRTEVAGGLAEVARTC